MAIGTSTAIALGGLAVSAGSAGMSFAQAGKQKQAQRKAEQDAAIAMDDARKKLEVNFYAQQGIKKEPYELEREALLSQGAQAIQAGVESERGAAATAGRVQLAMNEGQAGVRTAMGRELTDLENKQLAEESRLQGLSAGLDLEEAKGAGQAAAAARNLSAQSVQQGVAGLANTASQAINLIPLFAKSDSAKQYAALQQDYNKAVANGTLGGSFKDLNGNPLSLQQAISRMKNSGLDLTGASTMSPDAFQAFITGQNAGILKNIRKEGFGSGIRPYSQNPFQILPGEESMFPQ
jgi:hypothetical protein